HHAEARRLLEPHAATLSTQPTASYRLAVARAGSGDKEGAIEALRTAVQAGLRPVSGAATEPALEIVRRDPRYAALAARIARNAAPTADEAAFRAFDFWVGTWDARTQDGALQGRNRIERVLGGAALIERWTGATGLCG